MTLPISHKSNLCLKKNKDLSIQLCYQKGLKFAINKPVIVSQCSTPQQWKTFSHTKHSCYFCETNFEPAQQSIPLWSQSIYSIIIPAA